MIVWIVIAAAAACASAGERFVSTLGTIQREVTADRAAMTVEVKATGKSVEESNAKLEGLMADLQAQVAALNYPTSALSLVFRETERGREWDDKTKSWVPSGYDASANYSVILVGLTNYGRFPTYLGIHDGFQIRWRSMGSSAEGQARRQAIPEALRAARAKAALLAEESAAKLGRLLEATEEQVETREFEGARWGGNAPDPNAGTGAYPIGIFVRVRAKFELNDR